MKIKISRIALIETASFCCGVHSKRYSGEQDKMSFGRKLLLLKKITAL